MKKIMIGFCLCISLASCKKLIGIDSPHNQLSSDKVFADSTAALSALLNVYAQFDKNIEVNFSRFVGLYADELSFTGSTQQDLEFWQSQVSAGNSLNLTLWKNMYQAVYQCNDLIEQLPASGLPMQLVNRYSSEARFLRAYIYFYLINIYGDIPLLLTTDVNKSSKATRSKVEDVYAQVVEDLIKAKQGLTVNYEGGGKVRANSLAASALLARVYLFRQNWVGAEQEAEVVINSGLYSPLDAVANVFKANSRESILQFWTQNGFISGAPSLVPSSNVTLPTYPLTTTLYNSFEQGDLRKNLWIGSSTVTANNVVSTYRYMSKYKNRQANSTAPEYLMALRLSEQYLIRAEARAMQNKLMGLDGAAADLNKIRSRAGLPNTVAQTEADLLAAIWQERRAEFFGEWGMRFLDLKRIGKLNEVMSVYKSSWQAYVQYWPIPQNELSYNANLVQNMGY